MRIKINFVILLFLSLTAHFVAADDGVVRTALFVDRGCRGSGILRWAELLHLSPDVDLKLVDGADIRQGALEGCDLLVMPGGAGGPQYESLGDDGAERIRAFVAGGGSYFGTCFRKIVGVGFSICSVKIAEKDLSVGRKMKFSLNKILLIIIAFLVVTIFVGTTLAFSLKKAEPGKDLRQADPSPTEIQNLNNSSNQKLAAYTELGTIRAITAPDSKKQDDFGTPVIITAWITYPEGDTVFFEELARKKNVIINCISTYFLERTKLDLLSTSEEKIKADLLQIINGQLVLGKIQNVYFTDYLFLD